MVFVVWGRLHDLMSGRGMRIPFMQPLNGIVQNVISHTDAKILWNVTDGASTRVSDDEPWFSDIGHDRFPDFEDRASLISLEAIMKESLRWMTVAPLGLAHFTTEDDEFGGYSKLAGLGQRTCDTALNATL